MRRVKSYFDDYETFIWYNIHRICFYLRAQLFILHWDGTSYTEKRIFTDSVRKDSLDVYLCGGSCHKQPSCIDRGPLHHTEKRLRH